MSELEQAPFRVSLSLAEASPDEYWGMAAQSGTKAFLARFCEASGISQDEANSRPDRMLQEIQTARRDMLRTFENRQLSLAKYDFASTSKHVASNSDVATAQLASIPLSQAIEEYISENKRAGNWVAGTFKKKLAALEVLTQLLGTDCNLLSITKKDAQNAKRILLDLPANRNKIAKSRGLTLQQAAAVTNVTKLSSVTINGHLSIFQSFFDWTTKQGHSETNLFAGMRISSGRSKPSVLRQAFATEALKLVHRELTENTLGLVKTDSHKWASLIGMFSGARLNEICQMDLQDIQQEHGIWFFNLIDDGDNNKRLKSGAARRKVPVHAELINLGFLDYHSHQSCKHANRLFPDYSYCEMNGYGRALSRWFNGTLKPALNIKSKAHVFHGLRHTMVTRLAQAGVDEPIFQSIVGHERKGITQQVYMREGYTLPQLQAAINQYAV